MKTAENEVRKMKNEIDTDDATPVTVKNTIALKSTSEDTNQNIDQKNVLKRKKNTTHEKTKKRRRRIVVEEYSSSSDEDEYSLTVSNLPNDWTYVQIKNYIDKECGPVDEIEMLKHDDFCAIRLTFQTAEKCMETMNNLQDKEVNGRKLELQMSGKLSNDEPQQSETKAESFSDTTEIVPTVSPLGEDDTWNGNPKDLYGLKPQFLKSLGIKPPLDKWVHFRCDKSELRDVLELAGHVLMCSVVTLAHKYAKVMYSHPLEAVQAVSMLDGQLFYGQTLKVIMDKDPANSFVLPKGLPNIGLGLGIHGRPLRNISDQYNKYIEKQSSLINPILFTEVDAEVEFLNRKEMIALDNKITKEINKFRETVKNDKTLLKIKNIEDLDSYEPKDANKINLDIKSKPSSVGSNSPDLALSPKPNIRMNGPQIAPRPIGPQNFSAPRSTVRLTHEVQNNPQPFRPTPPIPQNVPSVPTFRPGPFNPTPSGQFRPPQGPFGHMSGPSFGPQPMSGPSFGPQPMSGPSFGPQPMSGPSFGPQPKPGPFGPGPMPRPQLPMNNMGPRPMMGPNVPIIKPQGNNVTVHFANLPPTTTFPLLSEKLAHCGQVMSVQLTTPGCAVATFAHRAQAERCFQTYNGMNVEGYMISVKIM